MLLENRQLAKTYKSRGQVAASANKKLGGNRLLERSQTSCGSKGNAGSMRRQARKLPI